MKAYCQRCGRIDQTASESGFCHKCKEIEKAEYNLVREYVRTHPNASVIEVHNQTQVALKTLDRMVVNGSLILVDHEEE